MHTALHERLAQRQIALPGAMRHTCGAMALVITFLLGIGNFACHRAAVESGNAMLANMPPPVLWMLRGLEFMLLAGALYAASQGTSQWLWLYGGYTLLNIGSAWAIVTGRMG